MGLGLRGLTVPRYPLPTKTSRHPVQSSGRSSSLCSVPDHVQRTVFSLLFEFFALFELYYFEIFLLAFFVHFVDLLVVAYFVQVVQLLLY